MQNAGREMRKEEILEEIENNLGVLLYFSGPNCNVCKALKPKINEASNKEFPKIEKIFIDVSLSPDIAAHFGVFSIPTILLFLDGREFARESRNISIAGFIEKLKRPYNLLINSKI